MSSANIVSMVLPPDLVARLDQTARQCERSRSAQCRVILQEALDQFTLAHRRAAAITEAVQSGRPIPKGGSSA